MSGFVAASIKQIIPSQRKVKHSYQCHLFVFQNFHKKDFEHKEGETVSLENFPHSMIIFFCQLLSYK